MDDHAAEVIAELPRKNDDGVPWFAITEPDGTVLATSGGPLGNIGFPSSVEGIRHLRQMLDRTVQRLSADEVDRLIATGLGAPLSKPGQRPMREWVLLPFDGAAGRRVDRAYAFVSGQG